MMPVSRFPNGTPGQHPKLVQSASDIACRRLRKLTRIPESDAAWLAQLGAYGLVRGCLVPPENIRRLRDLTRARTAITDERSREIQRLEKMLEDSGIKLSSVATDITGVSGRAMLEALIGGQTDPQVLAEFAKASMRTNESAGRVKSTRTRPGNRYLKRALGTAALAVSRSQTTYLGAKYRRIKSRRGPMKALVAVEHSMLTAIWHMLITGEVYRDPGPDYYTRRQPLRSKDHAVRQLEALGYQVTLQPLKEVS